MKSLGAVVSLLIAALMSGGAVQACAAQKARARDRVSVSLLLAVKVGAQRAEWSVRRTAEVIRKRCAGLRIRCELLPQAGGQANRLLLRFSPAADAAHVKRVLLARGLELRAVVSPPNPAPPREYATRAEAEAAARDDSDVLPLEDSGAEAYFVVVERATIITGDDLRDCVALRPDSHVISDGYEVDCRLRPAGAARLKAWTGANINHYLAVIFDGRVLSVPYVQAPIWLNVSVSGNFDRRRAEEVALILSSGNLPAPVELVDDEAY